MSWRHGAVFIRSPPFSGKTTLRVLLANWCSVHYPTLRVFHVSLLNFRLEDTCTEQAAVQWNSDWQHWVYEGVTQHGNTSWDQMLALSGPGGQPVLVLIDEAQLAYRYTSQFHFWRVVKAALGNDTSSRLAFILFATSSVSHNSSMPMPLQFPAENTLSFEDLRLRADERKVIFDQASRSFGHSLASVMVNKGALHFFFHLLSSAQSYKCGLLRQVASMLAFCVSILLRCSAS